MYINLMKGEAMRKSDIAFLFMVLIFGVSSIGMNYLFYWRKNAPFKMPENVEVPTFTRYDISSFSDSTTNTSHDDDW